MSKPTFSATIESLSHDGRGIAHREGKVIFIENGLPGEQVTFEYLKKRGSFDEGRVIDILAPSLERAQPRCAHVEECGGCSLQHLQPSAQIAYKEQAVLSQLKSIAHLTPHSLLPALSASA